eukprot:SAG31_NODE_45656_length_258_cov_0.641509_1_plen_26_part_10
MKHAPERLLDDAQLVLVAVRRSGEAL